MEERLEDPADEPIDQRGDTLLARPFMERIVIHRTMAYPLAPRPLQLLILPWRSTGPERSEEPHAAP
jgi:hypothetical protein